MAKLQENNKKNTNYSLSSLEKLQTIGAKVEEDNKEEEKRQKKSNTQKLVTFRMTEEKKQEYEKLFGAEGISLSGAIRMCLDYVMIQTKAGKLVISDSGIHENILNKLR